MSVNFERWTERSRQVIVLAQEEARTLKHNYIGTEHILLGLLREEQGIAARVLNGLGLTRDAVAEDITRIAGAGETVVPGQIPFTPRAKKVCEMALREALSLGHNYIGTEHVLLGMVRENEGIAARILLDADLDSEKVRTGVIRVLSGPRVYTQAKPKTYTVAGLKCGNCQWKQASNNGRHDIPRGRRISEALCPHCGCQTLTTPVAA